MPLGSNIPEFPGLHFTFMCIDDILIGNIDEHEQRMHLRLVFQCFQEYEISINTSKCIFGAPSTEFIGH